MGSRLWAEGTGRNEVIAQGCPWTRGVGRGSWPEAAEKRRRRNLSEPREDARGLGGGPGGENVANEGQPTGGGARSRSGALA